MITDREWAQLLAHAETLSADEARQLLAILKAEADQRARADGLWWLRYVQTRDEADPQAPIKPFPVDLPYVRPVWEAIHGASEVVIAKSRQMKITWIVCAYLVWHARYTPHQVIYYQTQGKDDAVEKVAMAQGGGFSGRCEFIEGHLPAFLTLPHTPSEGRIQYPNGSMIQALAGGANQIRGKVCSIYVGDEFAFQEEQEGVHTAVAPLIQKGAKAIFCSTPNGTANQFATLYHGFPVTEAQPA